MIIRISLDLTSKVRKLCFVFYLIKDHEHVPIIQISKDEAHCR